MTRWAWLAVGPFLLLATPAWAQNQVTIIWDDKSADEDGFRIERATGSITGTYAEITTVGANVTTYTDTDSALVAGTLYCYRVRAFNGGGNSAAYTNARCAVPGPKEQLRFKVTPAP